MQIILICRWRTAAPKRQDLRHIGGYRALPSPIPCYHDVSRAADYLPAGTPLVGMAGPAVLGSAASLRRPLDAIRVAPVTMFA